MKVVVEADGGSRGNPGPAGYGAVVFSADHGSVLAERAESIGRATNNVAEYRGLIAALEAAAEVGATQVEARMDSKLVVMQMSGSWQVKHPDMIPLARTAKEKASAFTRVTYKWIPRKENAHADRLANEAMDKAAGITAKPKKAAEPAEPPEETDAAPSTNSGWNAHTGAPTRLLLLRHGQTELSIGRRYSGRGNPVLTEVGVQQAKAAAVRIAGRGGIAAVLSSPLLRAQQTATAVADALGVPLTVHEGLIETDFGQWEGLTFAEAAQAFPAEHRAWLSDTSVPPPGGESFDTVHRRVRKARDEIISTYGGANVVLVSHVTPIKSLLRMALDSGPSLLYRLHLDLASLSIAEFYGDGGASVRLVNDTSHL